jgi:hypothetical protein
MAWIIQTWEIADSYGKPTGRWRMTATSDEDGGGPFGDDSHDHSTAAEAESCDKCDEFVNQVAGFPSKKHLRETEDQRDRAEYERLKKKFEG